MTQQDRTWVAVLIVAVLLVLIAIAGIGREPNTSLDRRAERGTMSAPTATLIGTLLGVGLGLVGDRYLRHRGIVHCQVEGFDAPVQLRGAGPFTIERGLDVHFFNKKEVDTGLSGLTVVFVFEGREEVVLGPATRGYQTNTSPRGVINLPSKTWTSVSIKGRFFGPEATLMAQQGPKAVDIKAKFPGGTPYHERCLELPG